MMLSARPSWTTLRIQAAPIAEFACMLRDGWPKIGSASGEHYVSAPVVYVVESPEWGREKGDERSLFGETRATTPPIGQYEDNKTPRPDLRHNDACRLVHVHNRWQRASRQHTTHNALRDPASQPQSVHSLLERALRRITATQVGS